MLVLLAAVAFVLPVLLIFLTAFKPEIEIMHFQPAAAALDARELSATSSGTPEEMPIFRWLFNSVLISSSVTLLVLTVDSLAAYARWRV